MASKQRSNSSKKDKPWTENEIRDLLTVWAEEEIQSKLKNGNDYEKGKAWKELTTKLAENGLDRTIASVKCKLRRLTAEYNGVRKEQSGNEGGEPNFGYYNMMHPILADRHESNSPNDGNTMVRQNGSDDISDTPEPLGKRRRIFGASTDGAGEKSDSNRSSYTSPQTKKNREAGEEEDKFIQTLKYMEQRFAEREERRHQEFMSLITSQQATLHLLLNLLQQQFQPELPSSQQQQQQLHSVQPTAHFSPQISTTQLSTSGQIPQDFEFNEHC